MEAGICGWESPHRRSPTPARDSAGAHPELRCAARRPAAARQGHGRNGTGTGTGGPRTAPRGTDCGGRRQRVRPAQAGQRRPAPARRAPTGLGSLAKRGGQRIYFLVLNPLQSLVSEVKFSASSKGNMPRRAGLFLKGEAF